jgi:hypothetical protein
MPDRQRRSWEPDDLLAAMDRHHLRLALAIVVGQLAPILAEGKPCRGHVSIEECVGNKATVLLAAMGIEVMPSDLLDLADEALAAAIEGDRVVVVQAAPTMFDLPLVMN